MTTRLVLSVSASVKKRPRSKGVRKTWKNSGLTEANSAERCFRRNRAGRAARMQFDSWY